MSIATMGGDGGQTGLAGGARLSKASPRMEALGTVDELGSVLGFARSICPNEGLRTIVKRIQRELFQVGSALSTLPEAPQGVPDLPDPLVDQLTAEVHQIEAIDGILSDWTLPGEDPAAAAFDVARTVCRRCERVVVGLVESGVPVPSNVIRYLNRLSDLLWLMGRQIEKEAGKDARLREDDQSGPRWSRAW